MKKSMKLASLFRIKLAPKLHPKQFFPYCTHVKTLSFRSANDLFGDPMQTLRFNQFTTSSTIESKSFSLHSDLLDYCNNCDSKSLEKLVRGVVRSSERLFFEPEDDMSSALEMAEAINRAVSMTGGSTFQSQIEPKLKAKEKADDASDFCFCESSVLMALDSNDPFEDFKKSMEEMVEFHGMKDWEILADLLSWYLIVNEKKNHEFILRAFFDMFSKLSI